MQASVLNVESCACRTHDVEKRFLSYWGSKMTSKKPAQSPSEAGPTQPNPRRVAAGRRNREKRLGLSEAGREALRETALLHQPWRFATGPRTAAGKARVALNGKVRQLGPKSAREVQNDLEGLGRMLREMAAARRAAESM